MRYPPLKRVTQGCRGSCSRFNVDLCVDLKALGQQDPELCCCFPDIGPRSAAPRQHCLHILLHKGHSFRQHEVMRHEPVHIPSDGCCILGDL